MKQYDVVIIGAGPGGLGLAYPLKDAGLKVAVVEENLWGGTCPNRGCDPKKVLLAAVEAKKRSEYLSGNGIQNVPEIDWEALMRFKKTFTDPVSEGSRQGLIDAGIDVFNGHAEFIDQVTLKIDDQQISSQKFVIATGQRPVRLTKVKHQELMQTSTDFLKMEHLPKKIAFVGGGYIAFELAMIATAAGAEVHIIHHNERPLKEFPSEYVQDLMTEMKVSGIKFDLNVDIQEVQQDGNQIRLSADNQFELSANRVFVTAGRRPNDDTLNLEKIGVATSKMGIEVDQNLMTTVENIYAMGDVIARKQPKLTPVSGFEARYLAQYLTQKTNDSIKYPAIPTVVYGMPKLAKVGVDLQMAEQHFEQYEIKTMDMTNWFTYRRIQDVKAKVTTIYDKTSQKMVGAVTISSEAENLINDLTTVINQGSQVINQIWAYPTEASDLGYM